MKKRKLFLTLFTLIVIFVSLFTFKQAVLAQDFYGLNDLNLALSNEVEPKSAIVNIINIILGFLGLIAVIIIIYGGFVWMMSGGEAEKIDKAKKILKNGLIGLVIILLSWGIATFVFNFFAGGGGGGGGATTCTVGETRNCGCDNLGTQECQADGSWDTCTIGPCNVIPVPDIDCNDGSFCTANDDICAQAGYPNLICSPITCKCVAPGSAGTSCNTNSNPLGVCMPDDDLCGEYLSCNSDTCLCEGSPVITEISPVGGFCEEDPNIPCEADFAGCHCNTNTPNGAENNLITIYGANFGDDPGQVMFGDASLPARLPSDVNSECVEYWSDKQIIVAVPDGIDSMPIIVKTDDEKETSTNDGIGPNIDDFQFNTISRPGLCKLNPDSGLFNESLTYYGVNMFGSPPGSNVYFGLYDEDQRIKGLNTGIFNNTTTTSYVPNISTGLTSTFVESPVLGVFLKSNYLNFSKNPEPDPLPYISSFEPLEGAPGQYVTIYGQGFGNQKGAKEVKIGTTTVDYIFPAVCADSVWSDDQIIVKVPATVPDGNHIISIEYPSETISTNNLNPDKFKVDSALALYPSLCKISPSKGQIGFAVSLWGEYFGTPTSTAAFHPGVSANGSVSQDGLADKLSVNVPESAITGPVLVRNGALEGNSLNFEIGPCQTDDECGSGNFCCPAGTYKANRCEASLDDCSLEVLNSVYEWSFATGLGTTTPPGPTIDSCLGWANQVGACPLDEFCPNSPGVCSAYPNQVQTVGECGDHKCVDIDGCDNAVDCSYNDGLNICIHKTEACSLANNYEYELDGQFFSAERSCQWYEADNEYRWHMTVNTSCPIGWTMTFNSVCVSDSICDACAGDLMCQDINNDGDIVGECVSQEICPPNSYCDASDNKCKEEVAGSCECCCEHGEDARDCCVPLQCKGECGVGSSGGTDYGNCYGCTVVDALGNILQDASNDACNCTGHINKYCDTTVPVVSPPLIPEGICGDCSAISDKDDCTDMSTCCWDDNTNECRGGDRIDSGANEGYCAYYDCTVLGDTCDIANQLITGPYSTIPQCNSACSNPEEYCNNFDNSADCGAEPDCCWNAKDGADVCRATIGGDEGKIDSGANIGFCAYYDCDEANPDICNTSDKTIDGDFSATSTCTLSCSGGGANNSGAPCYSITSSTCDQSICSNPFSCLQEDGTGSGTPPPLENCGRCCCDPANATSSCAFPDTEDLTCVADRAPCDGPGRGLCCGCSDDDSCGSSDESGCGADTCCRARPELEEFIPSDGSDDVCRNAVIKVKFDQFMDPSSLNSNIRLLEESDDTCPSGTYFTQNFKTEESNLLAKIWTSLKNLFTRSAVATTMPDPNKNYCLVPGSIQISQATSTTANFYPNELLKEETNYYILVIGDESLKSETGVMSSWQIGMNGTKSQAFNTVQYINSEIASFTTLSGDEPNSGVCALDYVRLMPDTYLFNRNDDDENESDNDVNDPSFDTIRDRDKLFTASAYSFDHQEIQGVLGYDWDWDLEISSNEDILSTSTAVGLGDNQMFVEVNDNVRDDVAELKATINMDAYNPGNSFFGGDDVYNTSDIYVFICRNPWPSINPDGTWAPYSYEYNTKFYYCRDSGSSAYIDDLPAVTDEPVDLQGFQKVCSFSGSFCSQDSDCDTANNEICISKVIRESYFFRQQGPSAGEILSAENDESAQRGGNIILNWKGSTKVIYDAGEFIGQNRIYYGKKDGGSMDYYNLSTTTLDSICSTNAAEYTCTSTVDNLENDETYLFRMSAISQSNIETMFKNEKEAIPVDVLAPGQLDNCDIEDYQPGDSEINIVCSMINQFLNDISFLRFYHGLSSGLYGQSFDSQIGAYSVTLPTSLFNKGVEHFFAVSAVDASGNESGKSDIMSVLIEDAP